MSDLDSHLRRLRDRAQPRAGGFDRQISLRRRRTRLRRGGTALFALGLSVATLMWVLPDFRAQDHPPAPGSGASAESTQGPQPCEPDVADTWKSKMAPWLTSLLMHVGAPEGWPLTANEISDNGSALRISPPQFADRIEAYVHAGVPDPEHDPVAQMELIGQHVGHRLFALRTPTVHVYHAEGPEVWLSLYLYAPSGSKSVDLAAASAMTWLRDMLSQIKEMPIPKC